MGRKPFWMMCAVFAAGMCFGGTIDAADNVINPGAAIAIR